MLLLAISVSRVWVGNSTGRRSAKMDSGDRNESSAAYADKEKTMDIDTPVGKVRKLCEELEESAKAARDRAQAEFVKAEAFENSAMRARIVLRSLEVPTTSG